MSASLKVRALRVPCEAVGIDGDAWDFCDSHEQEAAFNRGEYPEFNFPYFSPSPTERNFLDLVLSEEETEENGCRGSTRKLNPVERIKYLPLFRKYFPGLDTSLVRYINYVYYDGAEAPDYYE